MARPTLLAAERRPTRQIHVGAVAVGGGAPISVQSMTITKTADVEGTLAQIYALASAGADIVRCTCNEKEAAEGLAHIVPRSPVPIIADIHFHHEMALAALEAGVQGLRLNPGNLRKEAEIKQVAQEAKDRGVPIRIGVNAGSLHPELYKRFGGATPEALVESARMELAYFAEVDFDDVKISVKASSVPLMIEAYRLASETFDHPLHLGVTEAGPPPAGLVKGTAGIGTLLAEGIGDTIRYSLTADPVEEVRAGRQLLEAMGLRERKSVDLIACPSCGRAEIDVIGVARAAQEALESRQLPIQVAVMGCVVNGPGEAREADLGIAAGRHRGHLFIKGKIVRVVPEDEMVAALVEEAEKLVAEGIEARLAAADAGAEAEAEADRRMLIEAKGEDANHSAQKVELIRKTIDEGPSGPTAAAGRPAPEPSVGAAPPRRRARRRGRLRRHPEVCRRAVVSKRTVTPARLSCVSPSAPERTERDGTAKPVRDASSASADRGHLDGSGPTTFEGLGEQRRLGLVERDAHRGLEPGQRHRGLRPGVPAHEHRLAGVELTGADLHADGDALELPVDHPAAEGRVGAAVELRRRPAAESSAARAAALSPAPSSSRTTRTTTWTGARRGGIRRPASSPWAMTSAPMSRDDAPHEVCQTCSSLPGLVEEGDVEHPGEVLPELVAGAHLQRLAVAHHGFARPGGGGPREALARRSCGPSGRGRRGR